MVRPERENFDDVKSAGKVISALTDRNDGHSVTFMTSYGSARTHIKRQRDSHKNRNKRVRISESKIKRKRKRKRKGNECYRQIDK